MTFKPHGPNLRAADGFGEWFRPVVISDPPEALPVASRTMSASLHGMSDKSQAKRPPPHLSPGGTSAAGVRSAPITRAASDIGPVCARRLAEPGAAATVVDRRRRRRPLCLDGGGTVS